jgi:hypothetical protein
MFFLVNFFNINFHKKIILYPESGLKNAPRNIVETSLNLIWASITGRALYIF